MAAIPRDKAPDSSLALLREGYEFIPSRCRRYGSDIFRTRVMGQQVVCMSGPEAAELFYGGERFTRKRAVPRPTLTLLQDFGSVQGLDGAAHRHRKAMFMGLMTPDGIQRIARLSEAEWHAAIARWESSDEIRLDDEVREILCRAVCAWAGVPLSDAEAPRRAADLAAMFEGAGAFGPRQLRGQLARRRGEAWIQDVVEHIRSGRLRPGEDTAAHVIAHHRGLGGEPLTREVAAVELINLLRPTVAVTRFVTFAAMGLHDHPEWRERLRAGDDGDLERFTQEVRRFYPFFPLVTGRAAHELEWRGHRFAAGDWVMLDIYGTNRDGRTWDRPDEFDPERFRERTIGPFDMIPQGGGDHDTGHRCAGEWITIELVKVALRSLTAGMAYEVPEQDLRLRMWRMPTVPPSRFRIRSVRRAAPATPPAESPSTPAGAPRPAGRAPSR